MLARIGFFALCLLVWIESGQASTRYNVSVCAIFQNEAPYLREWLEYHKLIGVEHFYLYNNESSDHYLEVLMPYIRKGEVHLKDWATMQANRKSVTQVEAYNDVLPQARNETKWLAFIDLDEFIVPMKDDSLAAFLAEFESFGGIVINWQMYGTSGVKSLGPDDLLIEKLVFKHQSTHGPNFHVKSIVRPARVLGTKSSHRFAYKPGYYGVDAKKAIHQPHLGGKTSTLEIDVIRINHYWCKTEDFFYQIKLPRREKIEGKPKSEEEIKMILQKSNQVYDPCIFKYLPELKKRLGLSNA